jgi:NRAMP (natural resistance-associated macrophage protein)-like metal ion transporter
MPQPPSLRFVDIPSRLLQEGPRFTERANRLLQALGPGLITGASDDDPSGIGTYSQAGAQFGFGIGWTMLLTYPLMVGIQEISARIGRVTGHGIAGNVCRNFPAPMTWFLIVLLFVANTFNIAADLGAMADSLKLLVGGPAALYIVVFGTGSVLAQIVFEYTRYVRILKWLTLSLFSYVLALAVVHVPWEEAARGTSHSQNILRREFLDNADRCSRHHNLALSLCLAGFRRKRKINELTKTRNHSSAMLPR